ncbi:MAG: glycerophosphodiester phosphodiesterase family protein [Myxococcota bacterium]
MSPQRLSLDGPRPWVMAHRGASDLAPENSLASFDLAVEHGADLLETDIWLTADGQIVCHHDATLERMTGDPRRVNHVSLQQLQSLRLTTTHGIAGERVPTLAQVVEQTPPNVVIMAEIKDPMFRQPGPLAQLLRVLGPRVQAHRAGIIAESLRMLRAIKAQAPELVAGHIAITRPHANSTTELLGPYWPWLAINPLYVRRAHARGQRVCPLDPDLHRRLPRYLAMDVDAVLTNDPRATRALIETHRSRS